MKIKNKLLVIVGSLLLGGCSLFTSSPSSVVKKLVSASQRGDVDTIVSLWGNNAIQEQGAEKIRHNAETFVEAARKARAAGEDMQIKNLRETILGDRARVFFIYYDAKGRDSVGMGFALLKENGAWKLYRAIDIGEEDESFDSSFAPKKSPGMTPSPEPGPMEIASPVPPPPTNSNSNRKPENNSNSNSSAPTTSGETISGGVLNSKATRLPKPVYPPAAKAAKASGTVVVQVLVDENGNVMTADAASGPPLLRSSAEQAARIAHFQPTVLGGKRVKVRGTITYVFSPE